MSFCSCQWKLGWKISWQRPAPPHHLLPFADSGSSEKHLKHRDVSEPELSAFHASIFSLLALLSQCLFARHHIKINLQWDFFWNLPIQPQQCPSFPLLLTPPTSFPFSLSSSVNTQSCCWGSDSYQGKLHLIQVTPYTYRAAFLLFSICYASPLCAWSVRLGNLIQVAQHRA